MWFKYGLKVQKLLAQGNTLGFSKIFAMRPVRAKALKRGNDKAFSGSADLQSAAVWVTIADL